MLESSYDQYSRRTDLSASFTGAAATNIQGARYQHFDFDSLDRITRTIDSLDPIATGSKADVIVTDASFDTLGRIRSESFGNDGSGNTLWPVTSGYNTTGQRTRLTYPAHGTWPTKRLKYNWDDYGRLSAVVDLAADGVTEVETIASYAYSMGSRLVQTTRADNSKRSAPTATAWDGAGRRTSAKVLGTGVDLFEENLTFDKNGRVTRIEWPKGRLNETETEAQIYTYDELSRLTKFEQGRPKSDDPFKVDPAPGALTSAHEWQLDELGNWRQHQDKSADVNHPMVDVSLDPVNAYTAWPKDLNKDGTIQAAEIATLNYDDARGFMVKQPDGTTSGWKYWHDGFGRLSQVDRCQNVACTGSPSWSVEYRYMADGRMATRKKSTDTAATWYLYDGSQVIAEQTPTERSTWYVWSGSSLLQSARVLVANGSVDKLNLHQDRIGNVVLATRLNGSTIEMWGRLQFDPYGRKVSNITWEVNGVHVPYRFAGQRLDPDTGLYLMGARWYSAELGRFIEQDPIAEGGGLNLYAYTGSSPTMWVDPSGLRQESSRNERTLEQHAYSGSYMMSGGMKVLSDGVVADEGGERMDYASRHLEEASDDGLRQMDAAKSRFHGAVKALKDALKSGNKKAIVSARAELAASQGAAAGLVSKGAGLDAQRLLGKATPGTQTSDLAGEGDAKGESKTTPSSQPRLPGIIYVTGHEVELGGVSTGEWHSALEYTKPGPGEKPETRSAGPGGAYDLVSGKNRPSDAPENNSTLTVVDPPEGMSSEEYWNVLRVADSNYVDSDWDYDMYGSDPGEEGWNCNSWTVGIIQATGGTMRTRLALLPHSFSGTSNPVPPRAFKPK